MQGVFSMNRTLRDAKRLLLGEDGSESIAADFKEELTNSLKRIRLFKKRRLGGGGGSKTEERRKTKNKSLTLKSIIKLAKKDYKNKSWS